MMINLRETISRYFDHIVSFYSHKTTNAHRTEYFECQINRTASNRNWTCRCPCSSLSLISSDRCLSHVELRSTANRIYSLMCAFHCDSILIVAQLSVHNVIYITRKFNFIICSTCSSPLFKAHTSTVYNIESPFRWLIHISFVKSVATQCSIIICGVANRKGGSSSVQSASSAPSTSFDVQQFIEIHAAKNKTKKTKFHQPIHRIGI